MSKVVGDVAVRVGADIGPLKVGLQNAGRDVDRFGRKAKMSGAQIARRLASVGTAAIAMGGAVLAGSRQAISSLDAIGKKAAQIGTTAETLQELSFAAESAGVSNSALESSLERLTKRLGEASQGFGAAKQQLEFLGLSADDLMSMPLEQQLATIADKLKDIESPATRAAVAAGLFGREGVAMVNMLNDGSAALEETMNAARDFGAVVSNETVAAAEELQDKMGRLGDGIKGQLNDALVEAGPLLVSSAEFALRLATAFNGLVGAIGDVFNAFDALIDPQARLEQATDEVVRAMADEIQQSIQLEAALQRGGTMSVEAARVKLKEAQARHQNAQAAIAEQLAIAQGSDAIQSVNEQISGLTEARNALVAPGADDGVIPMRMREQVEGLDQSMAEAIARKQELLSIPEALAEQAKRAEENVAALDGALGSMVNGMVNLDGEGVVAPIDPREDQDVSGGGGAAPEARGASELDKLLGLDEESQQATAARMSSALERQAEFMATARDALNSAREQGLIDQETYNAASQALEEDHNREMNKIRMQNAASVLGSTATMFDALAQVSGKGAEKLLKVSKVASAAQAFVNTLQGASEALKLPFPSNLAAAATVMAQGLGFVAAIKGAQPGGAATAPTAASGGASGVADAGAASGGADAGALRPMVSLTLQGDNFSRAQIVQITEAINDGVDEGQQPVQLRGRR